MLGDVRWTSGLSIFDALVCCGETASEQQVKERDPFVAARFEALQSSVTNLFLATPLPSVDGMEIQISKRPHTRRKIHSLFDR